MATEQKNNVKNTPDLSILSDDDICDDSDWSNCGAFNRLTIALRYYESLNVKEAVTNKDIFCSFINDIYKQSLNDLNHLITCHGHQIQQINEKMIETQQCSMKTCKFTSRHFESESVVKDKDEDDVLSFYVEIFDSFHFWIYHCFDGGFRIEKIEQKEQNDESEENEGCDFQKLFDKEFARIGNEVKARSKLTESFARLSPNNNSKYTISVDTSSENEEKDSLFLDELCEHLIAVSIDVELIERLKNFIFDELYDTDSFKVDFEMKEGDGNISDHISKKEFVECILRFMKAIKVKELTFSVGFRFYYWDYYKHRKSLPRNEQIVSNDNTHDHSGYTVCELYVPPTYKSFKDEARNYPHFDIDKYKSATTKVEKYLPTDEVKGIKSGWYDRHSGWFMKAFYLHYGIDEHAVVSFDHLLALFCYTDYTKLSTAFSSSFRKNTPHESISSVKKRNSVFFWMSKHLRELVEIFGQCSYG